MRKGIILFIAYLVICIGSALAGVGLRTRFASLRMDNLLPGEVYNTREIVNLPFTVTNMGSDDMTGNITVYIPTGTGIREGFDPIEDILWVQVSDNIIDLRPGAAKTVDIIIRIPDEPQYYDRRFQANIEAIGRSKKGNVAAGIATIIYLTTVPTLEEKRKREKQEKERNKILANLNYEFIPGKTLLFDIKPGKKYDVGKESGKRLRIVNMNEEKYRYSVRSVSAEAAKLSVASGYEASDPDWLTFEKEIFEVDENTILPVKAVLKIPKGREHYGKNYQFFVQVDLLDQGIPVRIFSFVLVQMEKR